MGLAVTLLFDVAATEAVRALWNRLADTGIGTSMLDMGYPPHLTLIVLEDDCLASDLQLRLAQQAWDDGLAFELGAVGRFDGSEVVWLAGEGEKLRQLQQEVSKLVATEQIHPHYRPQSWVPHITLQMTGDARAAVALVGREWRRSVEARTIAVELVRFPPIVPIWRETLPFHGQIA
jgi:2'-5' RNA ligase